MNVDSFQPSGGPYNVRQRDLIGVSAFGLFISTVAVGLRMLARQRLRVALWWDDYLAILALVRIIEQRANDNE